MTPEHFDNELRHLSATVGNWDADELFPTMYAELLSKVQAGADKRRKVEQAQRMRKLLMLQAEWLLREWFSEKRKHGAMGFSQ